MSRHLPVKQTHPSHEHRTYSEQQVLLFWLLCKILRRLARTIPWAVLSKQDKRRLSTALAILESDVHLVQLVLSTQGSDGAGSRRKDGAGEQMSSRGPTADQATTKAAAPEEETS
jgi:hypothetical protein